ncbi:MAG: cytochrome c family protein, partial [Myxococcales bacterium]|nr:cytochrome c family protein [Myxococcales bacterium]
TLLPSPQQLQAELDRLEDKLAKFADDPSADAGFIARLQADRDDLKKQLADPSIDPTLAGAVITAQTKVTCRLPHDAAAKTALHDYDGWVAEQNRKRFAGVKPPAPAKGQAGYVGIDSCNECHEEAVAMWKTTVHAGAYETLVEGNKQFDLSCVNCHVTGFREPGGSEVVENQNLQDVQCEQCHGPGSLHVEDPTTDNIRLEAPTSVCLVCHTAEHSDTFDYVPYLRDILGEGHGAEARAKLGEGKTGRELRQAGLEAAGGRVA